MGEFRRTYSKVWWSNYFQDEDDTEEKPPSLARSVVRFSWRRTVAPADNANRNSSSSPSSGSHKSQDSGFSDSESSSSPSSCASSTDTQNSSTESQITAFELTKTSNAGTPKVESLPETPVNRIPRPTLIRHRKKEAKSADSTSPADSISHYLADCYFPVPTDTNAGTTTTPSSNELPSSPSSLQSSSSAVPSTPCSQGRTCFIVDELPKKHVEETPSELHQRKVDSSSSDISSSPSLSSLEEYKVDDTVRFMEEKKDCDENQPKIVEMLSEPTAELSPPPCINADLQKNECRLSNLDLSRLPEPTHTSTPKKDETNFARLTVRECQTETPVEQPDSKTSSINPIDPPVVRWLNELKHRYEPECMTALQSKVVAHCCRRSSTITISESASSAQTFQQKTKTIANEFLKLYDVLHDCRQDQLESQFKTLINCVMEFVINYSQLLPRMELSDKDNLLKLMDMCDRLRQIEFPHSCDQRSLLNNVNTLEKFFSRFVDSVLTQHIMLLTSILETPNPEATILVALSGLTTLSSNSSQTCELITYFNGVENLLAICLNTHSSTICRAALRTLAGVCQNATSIGRLEDAGGIEILSSLLSDQNKTEAEQLEVVSVLVQITAPWIEDDHVIKGLIYYLKPIFDALTRLICTTNSCETLLLAAAALANISFIEPQAIYMLIELNTVNCLLTAVRKLGARASIFLQEQVATLVANMAAMPESRSHLAQHRAVGALLCFLQVQHSPLLTAAEIAAAQRLQHKSAIALSRLCTNTEISKQIVELQGVNQLVRLCKEERERNFNDDVLVACLASLRKITANCGNESINQLNAKELVEPRLVDSFLLYSSRQESYV